MNKHLFSRHAYVLFFSLFLLFPLTSKAIVEVGGNFSYQKQVFGENREDSTISRTYSGYLAWYLFGLTALELNYSYDYDVYIDNQDTDLGSGIKITTLRKETKTDVYGIGLRQALAPTSAFLVPSLSVGYAKEHNRAKKNYTTNNNGVIQNFEYTTDDSYDNSVFGTFALKFQLTQRFSLTGSVRTVFPAFEWGEAKYNLKYLAGFSWLF